MVADFNALGSARDLYCNTQLAILSECVLVTNLHFGQFKMVFILIEVSFYIQKLGKILFSGIS